MVDPSDRFHELIAQVRAGSDAAAWQLVSEFGEAIRRSVRHSLHVKMRKQFDTLDFVQLVWRSIFRDRDKLGRFDAPNELAAFLAVIARNKVCSEMRKTLIAQKRDASREESIDAMPTRCRDEVAAREPAPHEVAIARERWAALLQGQPEHYQQIIQMRLQGYTIGEVAERLHVAESTVRRFLNRLLAATFE